MNRIINRCHRTISKSRLATAVCVKLRNQANAVIAAHLGESKDSNLNGEYALVDKVAPECRYFVDVGANTGQWAQYFRIRSKAGGTLFEPSQGAYAVLQDKFGGVPLVLRDVALGENEGSSWFIEEPNCGETSSFADTHSPTAIEPKKIQISTLDNELADKKICIDYLKIDAEGYDYMVLLGSKRLFSEGRIRFVQFEYNANWVFVGHSLIQAKRYLESLGFQLFIIRSTGLHAINYNYWGDYFRYSNYFACKPDQLNVVAELINRPI